MRSSKTYNFNVLFAGHVGAGKSTLIQSIALLLNQSLPQPEPFQILTPLPQLETKGPYGEKMSLTFIDSTGIQARAKIITESAVDLGPIVKVIQYLEQQYQYTLVEETKLVRQKIFDTHVHLVIYILDPSVCLANDGLSEIDRLFLIGVCGKANILPVVGKMDTLTKREKERLFPRLETQLLDFALLLDPEISPSLQKIFTAMNGEIDIHTSQPSTQREYIWGTVHQSQSDMAEMVESIMTCCQDLRASTNDEGYQDYRTKKLTSLIQVQPRVESRENGEEVTQLINLGVVLGLVQVSNYLNLEDPSRLDMLRISYALSQLINLCVLIYMRFMIKAKSDKTPLSFTEPKAPFAQEEPQVTITTHQDYDLSQLKAQASQLVFGFGFMLFLHLKFGYIRPLFFQTILGLKTLYSTPLFQVYILGSECEGALKRPWKAASPFGLPPSDSLAVKEVHKNELSPKKEVKEIKEKATKETAKNK